MIWATRDVRRPASDGLDAHETMRVVYLLGVVAATVIAVSVVDEGLLPTLLATFCGCALVTLVLAPGRRLASFGTFVAVTVALLARNYAELEPMARFWALANLVVLLSPFLLLPLRRTKGFPFLHLWCLFEAIYIYVASFVSHPLASQAQVFPPEVRETGYRMLFVFTATLVASGVLLLRSFRSRMSESEADAYFASGARELSVRSISRAYLLLVGGGSLMLVLGLTHLNATIGTGIDLIRAVAYAGGLMLALLWVEGRLPSQHKPIVLAAGLALALAGLGSGALYQAAVPAILLLGLLVGHRRRVPWVPMIAAVFVVILLNVNKPEFRADNWARGQGTSGSSTDLGVSYLQQTADVLDTTDEDRISTAANRFENSDLLGYTATWVPNRYPYFGAQAYARLPTLFIPRALLPDKESFNQANELGRRYELIAASDRMTTVNTPLHVEAYAAGGPLVMVVVAAVTGALLAAFGLLLRSGTPAAVITGCVLTLPTVLTIESGILPLVTILPFMAVLMLLLRWACRDRAPRPAVAARRS